MKIRYFIIGVFSCILSPAFCQSLKQAFLDPPRQARPIIIWQWMDGLVTKEGITKDLEAFKAAGLGGVQNFQIGGDLQGYIGDPTCAIMSDKWKGMMKWAMDECHRLGLTFGTHNCPGWSSSASPWVTEQYSMQQLVYSSTAIEHGKSNYLLPRPETNPQYNYYEDIAVLALPKGTVAPKEDIIDLTPYLDTASAKLTLPQSLLSSQRWKRVEKGVILRFGHTTNGRTNASQAPASGRGLECDKMSRKAVKRFWDSYPQQIIELAGDLAGTTFNRIEIDSYEAGGQDWSVVLPDEFRKRKGYDIIPYLPAITGKWQISDKAETKKFKDDLEDVVTSLFAENYYGYMASLAERTPGMRLLIEPYGTGTQKPFRVLDINKILNESPNAIVATEFWTKPNWGWKDMARHEAVVRNASIPTLYAEAFTCWPLRAWQDDPRSLKPLCDKAYCTGVNRMMLHAGATNPWPQVVPGMSFGKWGTQFVPGQTWWRAGGAKAFFDYMSRCQALLQQGKPAKIQPESMARLKAYVRIVGDTTIMFVCNPDDKPANDTLAISHEATQAELWDPYSLTMTTINPKSIIKKGQKAFIPLAVEPEGSRFVILHSHKPFAYGEKHTENCLATAAPDDQCTNLTINGPWTIKFDGQDTLTSDTLFDWATHPANEVRFFSGSAVYSLSLHVTGRQLAAMRTGGKAWLCLGDVKNMAEVKVNGKSFPVLWKSPFTCDILTALRKGTNTIDITVTNLWPNRMIGDEHEPDDIEWAEPYVYDYAPGKPIVGRFMKKVPQWLSSGDARPSAGRKTVSSFKFFTKGSSLLPSGLLGPVRLKWNKHPQQANQDAISRN